jgi:hypothetical protein
MTAPATIEASPEAATCTYWYWVSDGAVDPDVAEAAIVVATEAMGLLLVAPPVVRVAAGATWVLGHCRPT